MKIKIRTKKELENTNVFGTWGDWWHSKTAVCINNNMKRSLGLSVELLKIDPRFSNTDSTYTYYAELREGVRAYWHPDWVEFESLEDELNFLLLYVLEEQCK